jgi:predicted aldo/keto reductase-like oxidoreductase
MAEFALARDSAILRGMKYRRFGRTELPMPVISCGGMRYQHKWQDVKPNEIPPDNQANLEACIHRALELGINHIETARGYGTSEMQLGWVLPKLPREKLIVHTVTSVTPASCNQESPYEMRGLCATGTSGRGSSRSKAESAR